MSRMGLAWALAYFLGLGASIVNPFWGTLTYLLEYYLRPALHWWGKGLPDLRWNFTVAAVLTATYLLRRSSLKDIGPARKLPGLCLAALAVYMLLMTPLAANPARSEIKTGSYLKMILYHGLIVATVRSPAAFDMFAAANMAGAGWWGWEAYRNPKRTAGRLANVGSGDTLGDNGAAAHLMTVIPFIVIYLLVHSDWRIKLLAMAVAPFVVNTIILCNSRGAILALIVSAFAALAIVKSGHRLRMVLAGVGCALAFLALADPQFLDRQQTTRRFGEDGSATGRLEAWRGAVDLVVDHPLGVGGDGFWELSPVYARELVERMGEKRDPHNTVVLVASEWGFPGIALYFAYYLSCASLLAEVRRKSSGGIWFYRSVAVQLAMIGIFVAGLFTDRLYSEAPYWMGALAVALHRLQSYESAATVEYGREVTSGGLAHLPVPVRP